MQYANCRFQAIEGVMFLIACSSTLFLISYNSEQRVKGRVGLTSRQVFVAHMVIYVSAGIIAALSADIISPSLLVPSGLYCFLNFRHPLGGAIFGVPLMIILTAIIHRYYLLYRYINNSRRQLQRIFDTQIRRTSIASSTLPITIGMINDPHYEAYQRQIKVAKQMAVYVTAFLICYSPACVILVTEAIWRRDIAPVAYIIGGMLAHVNALLDPLLYVYMNRGAREEVLNAFNMMCCHFCSRYNVTHQQTHKLVLERNTSQIFTRAEETTRTRPPALGGYNNKQPSPTHRQVIVISPKHLKDGRTVEALIEVAEKPAHVLGLLPPDTTVDTPPLQAVSEQNELEPGAVNV